MSVNARSDKPIAFTKIDLPYGWLGNMSRHPVKYDGKLWPTTEHLFQALRFDDPAIKQKILAEPNPFKAKLVAKRHKAQMVIPQRGRRDVANIERVLRLKLKHHPELREELLATGNQTIIEDCSNRPHGSGKFWGAAWQDGQWVGENVLGKLWMKVRSDLNARPGQEVGTMVMNSEARSGKVIAFTKVALPFGWLSNLAPFPVKYDGKWWKTTEQLFQALRFDDAVVREQIRRITSPMAARFVVKRKMVVVPQSKQDLANMEMVLRLKLKHHPDLKQQLVDTGDRTIIEDCSSRARESGMFWGAALKDGQWVGKNMLGKLWMKVRSQLKKRRPSVTESDFTIEDVQSLKQLMARLGPQTVVNLLKILA